MFIFDHLAEIVFNFIIFLKRLVSQKCLQMLLLFYISVSCSAVKRIWPKLSNGCGETLVHFFVNFFVLFVKLGFCVQPKYERGLGLRSVM